MKTRAHSISIAFGFASVSDIDCIFKNDQLNQLKCTDLNISLESNTSWVSNQLLLFSIENFTKTISERTEIFLINIFLIVSS